jgi:hypothetical protein
MKKSLAPSTLLAVALAVPAFTGCQTQDAGPYRPANVQGKDVENSANVVLMDSNMHSSVDCSGTQYTRLPDGRLQVQANLRNRINERLHVQVGCVFKDAQGFQVEESNFHDLILTEHAQETVTFESLNDKAQRYTIRVREAR